MAINQKISCICVTENRTELLKKAIQYYNNQTYQNKELIILYPSSDIQTEALATSTDVYNRLVLNEKDGEWISSIEFKGSSEIYFVKMTSLTKLSLGAKRNLAIQSAHGEYICVWDDDDYYSKERLERQFNFLIFSNKEAVALSQLTLYFQETGKAYVSNARHEGWEGSLLCKKEAMGKYSDLERGEDSPVIYGLYQQDKLAIMEDESLYVYNVHISNTSTSNHFTRLVNLSTELGDIKTKVLKEEMGIPVKEVTTYDAILSLGAWCQVGAASRVRSFNFLNSPFHNFGVKTWQNVIQILEDRFEDYWVMDNMAIGKPEENYSARYEDKRMVYKVYCNKYDMLCNHHFDVEDNEADKLLTYDAFKEKIDVLGDVFLEQCKQYHKVLFCMKVMSAPNPTEINRGDIKRLCDVLNDIRYGKPYDLRISVPEEFYHQVVEWVKEDNLTHVKVFSWTIPFNDEYFAEEWENMYGDVAIAPDYMFRLNKDIFQVHVEEFQHITYLNS